MNREDILKMKLLLTFIMFIFSVGVGLFLLPSFSLGSCRINNLSLEKDGNFIRLTIYADSAFEFVHSAREKDGNKPYMVIIDCKDAIFDLPQHKFKDDLPPGTIRAIRTSQFQAEPEKIVRIVLDLDKPAIYKVVDKGEDKKGTIAVLTGQESDFPFWSAVENEKASPENKLAPSTPVEKTTRERIETQDNLLDSSENSNLPDLASIENAKGEEAEEKTTFERRLSFADTSEINASNEISQVSMPKVETEKSKFGAVGKDAEVKEKTSEKTNEEIVLATPAPSLEILSPNQKIEQLPSEQVEDKKAKTEVEKEVSKASLPKPSPSASVKIEKEGSSSLQPAPGSESSTLFTVPEKGRSEQSRSAESQKLSLVEDSEQNQTKETSSKSLNRKEYVQPESLSLNRSLASPKEAIALAGEVQKEGEHAERSKTDLVNLPAEEDLSAEEKSESGEEDSSEGLLAASSPQGTELGVVPQREIIYYHGEGKRDPFARLAERISTEFGEIPPPNFESLKLVGILRDEGGNRALLEDERGYGYIMKTGDKIKNGYVVFVEDNKVIFQIQEYGWSKTIALELSPAY